MVELRPRNAIQQAVDLAAQEDGDERQCCAQQAARGDGLGRESPTLNSGWRRMSSNRATGSRMAAAHKNWLGDCSLRLSGQGRQRKYQVGIDRGRDQQNRQDGSK